MFFKKNKLFVKAAVFTFFAGCFLFFSYAAFKIPQQPVNYVSDYANLLSSQQQQTLNLLLSQYEKQTATQIFVGVFSSLEGEFLEDISMRIAEKWKPGQTFKDNGVLFLIFLEDKKMRIEVGYGLESVLTDALARAIIVNEVKPLFLNGEFYQGIYQALKKIILVVSGQMPQDECSQYLDRATKQNRGGGLLGFLLFIVFIVIFIRNPWLALFLLSSNGYSSGGRYSSGGGGFGGGGGGGFGGGGASGGW